MKSYRIIYNQDETNLFAITKEPITPGHVDRMVDEVADAGVDVLLVNPQAQRTNYPSKAWQTNWDGYVPGDRAFWGPVPDAEVKEREAWVVQMKRLADQGCNYLARALARCRAKGIAPGITVRMNDMHDAPTPGTHLFSRFYMEHPEFRLNNGPFCGWSATGLNYEHAEVRECFLALIRELACDYDCDVLELDFLRFHCYFPRRDFVRHCAIMTGFVRDVRAILDKSGRRVALMARIAASPAAAYELGFDVAAWARDRLVDGISAGAFLNSQWQVPVADFRALVGDRVAVYACTDCPADRRPGLPMRKIPVEPALLRGFAAGHLAAGADGVELFNFFCAREEGWGTPQEPSFATLREMRALEPLRGAEKTYTVMSGWANGETDGVQQVPVTLERAQTRTFRILLAAEPEGTPIEAAVVFTEGTGMRPDQLWLHVNDTPVGPATAADTLPEPAKDLRQAVFGVPPAALRDGNNELVLRNEGESLTIISLEVRVALNAR